jgi:hypothetical protein
MMRKMMHTLCTNAWDVQVCILECLLFSWDILTRVKFASSAYKDSRTVHHVRQMCVLMQDTDDDLVQVKTHLL